MRSVEQLLIDALGELGVPDAGRLPEYPGVWVGLDGPNPRKIAAIGVRLARGRTMHGFALNISTDLAYMREHIVACGIADRPVTSFAEEGIDASMRDVVEVITRLAAERWGGGAVERQDIAWQQRPDDLAPFSRGEGAGEPVTFRPPRSHARLEQAGVTAGLVDRVAQARLAATEGAARHRGARSRRRRCASSDWSPCARTPAAPTSPSAGPTARRRSWCSASAAPAPAASASSTRASRSPPAADEPQRVAEAIDRMALDHAVLTMVARDDLADGGMAHVAACVEAIRAVARAPRSRR